MAISDETYTSEVSNRPTMLDSITFCTLYFKKHVTRNSDTVGMKNMENVILEGILK